MFNLRTKIILAAANIAGIVLGFMVYSQQLKNTNPLLWLLVIDCPLAAVFYLIWLFGFKNKYFELLARLSLIKYGLWTLFVVLTSWDYFNSKYVFVIILFHLGMIIEGVLKTSVFEIKHYAPAFVFFIINDFSDYFLSTHPQLNPLFYNQTLLFTLSSSFLLPLFFFLFQKLLIKPAVTK